MPPDLSDYAFDPVTIEDLDKPFHRIQLTPEQIKREARNRWFRTPSGNERNPLFWDSKTDDTGVTLPVINYALKATYGGSVRMEADHFIPITAWTLYRPHSPTLIQQGGYVIRNTWRSPHELEQTSEADIQPLLDFLAKAFPDETEATTYLLDTLAFRAQMRDVIRQELIICLYSPEGATGKGAVFDVLDYAFGPASWKKTNKESAFHDKNLNENWERNWLLLDEVTLAYGDMAKIRAKVSAREADANAKNMGSIRYETIAVPVLACNTPPTIDAPTARRTLLLRSHLGEVMDLKERTRYLTDLKQWIHDNGQLIWSYLLTRDVSHYLPYEDAPATAERDKRVKITEATPEATLAIALAEQPEWIVWPKVALKHRHNLSYQDIKNRHEFLAAGLDPDQSRELKIEGKNRMVLLRVGYKFTGPSKITGPEGETYTTTEDGGYRAMVQDIIDEAQEGKS